MAYVVLNLLLAIGSIIFALKCGGRTERSAALTMTAVAVVAVSGQLLFERRYASVDPVGLAQDLIAFGGLAFTGYNAKRIWPLWAAAFQLLSLSAHFVRALEIPVRPIVYAWMKSGPTWAVYILLIIATITHCLKTRSQGNGLS